MNDKPSWDEILVEELASACESYDNDDNSCWYFNEDAAYRAIHRAKAAGMREAAFYIDQFTMPEFNISKTIDHLLQEAVKIENDDDETDS